MDIEKELIHIAKQEGMLNPIMKHPWKSAAGQGYWADIDIVHLEGSNQVGQTITLSFVIKTAPNNAKLREISLSSVIFGREIFMYTAIFPKFYNFEEKKGIANPFTCAAKCFYSLSTSIPERLILENLEESGFKIWNRKQQMEDEQVKIVMKKYGRFHAISFAIKDQHPEYFRKLTENFDNVFDKFFEKTGFYYTFPNQAKKAKEALDPKEDECVLRKYVTFLDTVGETFKELVCCTEKYSTILHGDCWSNNMMFKYEDLNHPEQPTDIRLIDFQLSRLGSPAYDLAYFFYPCVSNNIFRNANFYKRVYYDSFTKHLMKLGSDPEKVYPFEVFEEHWRKYAKFGIVISSLLIHAMLTEKNEGLDFTQVIKLDNDLHRVFDYEISNIKEYNQRMKNIIVYCAQNNFI